MIANDVLLVFKPLPNLQQKTLAYVLNHVRFSISFIHEVLSFNTVSVSCVKDDSRVEICTASVYSVVYIWVKFPAD